MTPATPLRILIGKRVLEFRKKEGFSQQYLADCIGRSRISIVNIELGTQRCNLETLYTLAVALKLDITDLIPSQKEWEELDEM